MLPVIPYNRAAAVAYAHRWPLAEIRNIMTMKKSAATAPILPPNVYMPEREL